MKNWDVGSESLSILGWEEKSNEDGIYNPYSASSIKKKIENEFTAEQILRLDPMTLAYANGTLGDEAYVYEAVFEFFVLDPIKFGLSVLNTFRECGVKTLQGLDHIMKNPKTTVNEITKFLKDSKEIVNLLGAENTIKLAEKMIAVSTIDAGKSIKNNIKNYPANFKEEFQEAEKSKKIKMSTKLVCSIIVAKELLQKGAKYGIKSIKKIKNASKVGSSLETVALEEALANNQSSITTKTNKIFKDGAERAAAFSKEWPKASLKDTIKKFAPEAEIIKIPSKGKIIYRNSKTGIEVVHDIKGNYFRIKDTNITAFRKHLDLKGKIPNNKVVNNKISGRSKPEYEQVTHFNNTD
ncbi:MAG: hypothetical protein GY830_03720 [Bacteroidetes bacterium]|nr:hypothetical protein [Bacteroidota bacterium]